MPTDLRHLEATLGNLRRAERGVAGIVAYVEEARERLAAAPETEREAATRHLEFCEVRMRGDALILSQHLAAIATTAGVVAP